MLSIIKISYFNYFFVLIFLLVASDPLIAKNQNETATNELVALCEKMTFKDKDIVEVKRLLEAGADVNGMMNSNGNYPLYEASEKGYIEIVKLLY